MLEIIIIAVWRNCFWALV